ncbi:MAG: hypothetical protein EXR53_00010 [Dehalococcoidia bacterium]|nr:hypothetical protein [Dehalococcoidia bacterium]
MAFLGDILVIDGAPEFRQRIAVWLESQWYRLAFVRDATEAAAIQRSRSFSALFYGHEFLFRTTTARFGHGTTSKKPKIPP